MTIAIPIFVALVLACNPYDNINLRNSVFSIKPIQRFAKKTLPFGVVHRFGDLRLQHPTSITVLEVAPDGNTIAVGDDKGNIKIWNVINGQVQTELIGHKESIRAMVFLPDGKKLVSASGRGDDDPERDNSIRMWDIERRKEIRQLGSVKRGATGLTVSKDGKFLVSSSSFESLTFIEIDSGKKTEKKPSQHVGFWSLHYSQNEKMLAGVTYGWQALVWDVATGKIITQTEKKKNKIVRVEFSAVNKTLITASVDGVLHYWSLPSGKLFKEHSVCSTGLTAMALSSNGHLIAVAGSDGFIRFIESASGKEIAKTTIRFGEKNVRSLAWSPDNKTLFSGGWAGAIRIWDSATGKEINNSTQPRGQIFALALPTPKLLLAECGAQLFFFELPSFKPQGSLQTTRLSDWRRLAVSPDGKLLVASDHTPQIELWEIKKRKLLRVIQLPKKELVPSIRVVNFSFDSTHILGAGDDDIIIWDASTGVFCFQLQVPKQDVRCMAVASKAQIVVTGGGDERVRLWDLTKKMQIWASPEPKRQFRRSLHAVAIAPNGEWIAASFNDVIVTFWDSTRRQPKTFQVPGPITMMKSSVNGKYIYIGTSSGALCRYDTTSGKIDIRQNAHGGSITDIVVDPVDNFLVSTARDGSTYYWNVKGLFTPKKE